MNSRLFVVMGAMVVMAGCRTATHVKDIPRVDLELSGGNRGYLVGAPPQGGDLKTTRQIIQTDVEIPSYYKPKPAAGVAPAQDAAAADAGAFEADQSAAAQGVSVPSGPMDTYVVKKNDTLSGIAAKPEIYGKASQWKRILDANAELLKGNPNHIRAGMKLRIPRGQAASEPALSGKDSGSTVFSK